MFTVNHLVRVFNHLRRGTLKGRLHWEWRQYLKQRRLDWWKSQVGKREYVEKVLHPDIRMRLYFDSWLCHSIYYGEFETGELSFLKAFLKPGDVFVDIGANIGLFTLVAAQCVGHTGRVYAFEPCSSTYERLINNVKLNRLSNVSCQQMGLGEKRHETEMTVSLDGFDAWNSIARPTMGKLFKKEPIRCTTLDDFAHDQNLVGCLTMVKIDVEGWESRVLEGGGKTLSGKNAPILQVEFSGKASRSAGSSCEKTYQFLEELGFKMFTYDPRSQSLNPDPVRKEYSYLNLLAIKDAEKVATRIRENISPHVSMHRGNRAEEGN